MIKWRGENNIKAVTHTCRGGGGGGDGGGAVRTVQRHAHKVVAQLHSLFPPGVARVINDIYFS